MDLNIVLILLKHILSSFLVVVNDNIESIETNVENFYKKKQICHLYYKRQQT